MKRLMEFTGFIVPGRPTGQTDPISCLDRAAGGKTSEGGVDVMGIIIRLPERLVPADRSSQRGRPTSGAIARLDRVIARYERDLALLTGKLVPIRGDVDDLIILEYFAASDDPQGLISDRRLRIKTLEATIGLLQEHVTGAC